MGDMKDEDFEKVKIESTHSVEITALVEQAQINPKFSTNLTFWSRHRGPPKAETGHGGLD
jgi:non-homologous end joining protein Ku